jgi:hypothetical protein
MPRLIKREREFHGQTPGKGRHPLYSSWQQMISRCTNTSHGRYRDYGGRGVGVADRWLSFAAFVEDMGDRPPGHQIERIDNEKGYTPDNCRWASRIDQARNKRNNRMLAYQGLTLSVAAWADVTGIRESTIRRRLALGWAAERALATRVDGSVTA